MVQVLVIYYSVNGAVESLARAVVRGADSVDGANARLRTLPGVSARTEAAQDPIPGAGPPYASLDDLRECDALALGSPTRFGNMAAPVKYFLDGTASLWLSGVLADKPAGVFTSAASMHGGHESTLLSMQVPLLHHGMLLCGVPFTEPALNRTRSGGAPYGATRFSPEGRPDGLDEHETAVAFALGRRLSELAVRLA